MFNIEQIYGKNAATSKFNGLYFAMDLNGITSPKNQRLLFDYFENKDPGHLQGKQNHIRQSLFHLENKLQINFRQFFYILNSSNKCNF
jgi:hypothetical protein